MQSRNVHSRDLLGMWLALVAFAVVLAFRADAQEPAIALLLVASVALAGALRESPRQRRH